MSIYAVPMNLTDRWTNDEAKKPGLRAYLDIEKQRMFMTFKSKGGHFKGVDFDLTFTTIRKCESNDRNFYWIDNDNVMMVRAILHARLQHQSLLSLEAYIAKVNYDDLIVDDGKLALNGAKWEIQQYWLKEFLTEENVRIIYRAYA